MEEKADNPEKKDLMERIIHNPYFVFSGWIIAIISVIVAVVLPLNMRETRELVYAINPVRTQIVSAGKASGLDVLFKGEKLGDIDVTAVQVGIWNSGDLSIRTENILKEITINITINLESPAKILEASIVKFNREQEVTGFELRDTSETLTKGIVPVTWKILEKNDGGTIQIIYLGSTNATISVDGLIESAGNAKRVESGVTIKSPEEQISDKISTRLSLIVILSIFSLAFIVAIVITVYQVKHRKIKRGDILKEYLMPLLFSLAPICIMIYYLVDSFRIIGPPFGF